MERESVVLIDKKDRKIGLKDKVKAHLGNGFLHRAFMVFVFDNEGKILLQKRSADKMLWPLFWDCSCASHPRASETQEEAGTRRLKEEIGVNCPVGKISSFKYQAKYKNIGSEYEVCALLVGKYQGEIKADPAEVAEWKWTDINDLKKDLKDNPKKYTPWLKIGLLQYLKYEQEKKLIKKKINNFLAEITDSVNKVMNNLLALYADKENKELIEYQVSTGGKRLRPALAIICCKLLGKKTKDVLYAAAGLELIHNYSLIVDDVIDNSPLRRNEPTVWAKFGKSIAQCIGLDYSATIFQAANRSKKSVEITEVFSRAIKEIFAGEVLDILFEQTGREEDPYVVKNRYKDITEDNYLEMVCKKTASLFGASCEIGAICADANLKETKLLKDYGFNLGMAFQISDDILDIFGKEESFGKKIGKDIEEGKGGNAVIFLASKEFSEEDKKVFWDIIRKKSNTEEDIKMAINLIQKTNAKEKALDYARSFAEKAKRDLFLLPQNKWNYFLMGITNLVVERDK